MSQSKKKREIFLLSKLTLWDYLLFLGMAFFLLFIFVFISRMFDSPGSQTSPFQTALRTVPARSIQAMSNTSSLWSKEEYFVPSVESEGSRFFTPGEQKLVSPVANPSEGEGIYVLEALDIATGQTQWQTTIPDPVYIRIYQDKFFITAWEWMDQAPARGGQELVYCAFREREYSLSAYDVVTGQKAWGYGYRGVNIGRVYFQGQSAFLEGSHDHGNHRLLVNIDINSGHINNQHCNGSNSAIPLNSGGIYSSAYNVTYVERQDYDCDRRKQFCFATEGNRLHILIGNSKQTVAYITFGAS